MSKYNFTKSAQELSLNGIQTKVEIDPESGYGCFEQWDEQSGGNLHYCEGGLWFSGNELCDYDGAFELSPTMLNLIESLGFDASYAK